MDNRDDTTNIHFNPDFIARKSETQVKSKFHVNPAFFQKSGPHKAFLQSVQQNLSTTGNASVSIKNIHQASSPPKAIQHLSNTIQTSSSTTPKQLESHQAGSSSSLVYNFGSQRPVFVNSQSTYSSVSPKSQVSYVNSVKPSIYSWRTHSVSSQHNHLGLPVDSSSPSRFKYLCHSKVKDGFPNFGGNLSELAKNKFKVDNRTGAHSVERKTKHGYEKYCIIRESEKACANVVSRKVNSKTSGKAERFGIVKTGNISSTGKDLVKENRRKVNNTLPYAKSRSVYSLSNVNCCGVGSKPNVSSGASNSLLSGPTLSDQILTSVKRDSPHSSESGANHFTKTPINSHTEGKLKASPVKSSNILINPILLKSLSSSDKVDIVAIASKSSPKKVVVPSLSFSDSKHGSQTQTEIKSAIKPTPSMVSNKYRVITKTKLVRRRSKSFSKTKLTTPIKETRLDCVPLVYSLSRKKDGSHITLCRPSPVFPARPHSILAKNHPKRRYTVISRNKLVRRLSGSSPVVDNMLERPKYTIKTETKLVKRPSSSVLKAVKDSSKVQDVTVDNEVKKNYMVLSKTKLIRRKPSAGVLKTKVLREASKFNTRTIIRRHKLVRNVPIRSGKVSVLKNVDAKVMRKIHTKYKIENRGIALSAKQKAAKGIVSKYRINRLKVDFPTLKRNSNKRFTWASTRVKASHHLQETRKRDSGSFSDRFVNIGSILYKATKTSLHKQTAKKQLSNVAAKGSKCILKLHGNQYSVSAGGRTLTRLESKPLSTSKPLLSRVHIGGLTYSRTKTGHYELTKAHQARAVLSSAKHRSMVTLSQKKRRGTLQKCNQYCIFFNRFGRCTKKDKGDCPYLHDPTKIAICTRFLRGRCPVSNCPFSHKIDPDKMPVCSHFVRSICTRDDCPYRHVRVSPNAPICLDFLHGHCPLGQECKKHHVLECEEFSTSGKCPRGEACPLSHRKGSRKKKKSVSLEPVTPCTSLMKMHVSQPRRLKSSDSVDVLGEPSIKQKKKKVVAADDDDGILKRYFHVGMGNLPSVEDGVVMKDIESRGQKVDDNSSTRKDEMEVDLLERSFCSDVPGDELKEQLTGIAGIKEETPSALYLEQKRGNMLQKIEQLKGMYETPPGSSSSNKDSDGDKAQANKRGICSNMTKEKQDDTQGFKCDAFERRPLPKKMPSFISLSRNVGDVEDL